MKVQLPYGQGHLAFDVPDTCHSVLIEPAFSPSLADPEDSLHQALKEPLASPALSSLMQPSDRVGIIINDITRATPSRLIVHTLLQELPQVRPENITLFIALGTHRSNTPDELRQMLGDDLVDHFRIVQNDAFDPATQIHLGQTRRGHPIWLNRELWDCDIKILTGFIEPHFFAGFSGGGKAIMPGMAGLATILGNHSAAMIADPNAAWGRTAGNPIWEEILEVALLARRTFLLNVTLNKHKAITGVYCGDLQAAHAAGCAAAKQAALVPVAEPFDIVVTTNSGYPLDINLYQSVKGMSAAAQVVKPGGTIILAAECRDGIPAHGRYGALLKGRTSPRQVLDDIFALPQPSLDQWQAQVQAIIQLKADVYVYSRGLSDAQIQSALLRPCQSLETTLADLLARYGPQARLCILPEGPQTIPYLIPSLPRERAG